MSDASRPRLARPVAMRIDDEACNQCGACDDVAPGIRESPERIPVSPATLEAMAECPAGAISWVEGEHDHEDAGRA